MIGIRSGSWSARISETGAELKSLSSISSGQEYIWNGDPAWWNGSAPVLFPVIGGLKGGEYSYEGRSYKLPSHGFARNSDFSVTRSSPDSVELTLTSSPKTREGYPFDFSLAVTFQLENAGIAVRYDVRNTGTARMYFSIGSHPAFVLPFAGGALENYYVLFEREESLERWFFKDGIIAAGKTEEVMENSRVLSLPRTAFDQGIMIFKHPVSREFSIVNSRNSRAIRVLTDGVPYLGVWSKPGGAPFLCIEPWHGIPDMGDTSGNLVDKEGIICLEPRAVFSTGYRVQIDQLTAAAVSEYISRPMAPKQTRFERQVEEVLVTFDFERVHHVMESISWTWANLDRVPTLAELKAEARRLLAELDGSPGVHGSGGLRASYKDDGTLSLKFILCESWSDLSEDAGPGSP